jgi:hypothetical protein
MSTEKKTGLINKTSVAKARLKERIKPSSMNIEQCKYYRLNRFGEK